MRFYVVTYNKYYPVCIQHGEDCDDIKHCKREYAIVRAIFGGSVGSMYNTPGKARSQVTRLNKYYENAQLNPSQYARMPNLAPDARVQFVDTEDMMELGEHEIDEPVARAEAKMLHYAALMQKLER